MTFTITFWGVVETLGAIGVGCFLVLIGMAIAAPRWPG